jgi:glucans biosynthesis protein
MTYRTNRTWMCGSMPLRCALCALFLVASQACGGEVNDVFAKVIQQAKTAAKAPFQPNDSAFPEVLRKLDYDSYRKITFRRERSLWRRADEPFRVQFFHPGYLFNHPVRIHEIVRGKIRDVPFSPKYFRYPDFNPAPLAGHSELGFAGLRILYPLNHRDRWDEVISFVGSSYFRALGEGQIYGISARGLAVNTGENLNEEFPAFREFWLVKPASLARQIEFFALLDGPSVTGAYRFLLTPGADTQVEIEAHLFFRQTVKALGIAPLTSMFWRGESDPRPPNDKRPEVHDSDGLLIGADEWHPLAAAAQITTQFFPRKSATSFSLLQRDRDPAHYDDREARYERRPSVRVEPLNDWGAGSIVLFQLPAQNEYNDNVVAFWQPQNLPEAGDELTVNYRLHWFTQRSNKP